MCRLVTRSQLVPSRITVHPHVRRLVGIHVSDVKVNHRPGFMLVAMDLVHESCYLASHAARPGRVA